MIIGIGRMCKRLHIRAADAFPTGGFILAATIKDIALRAGVSVSTVSRVISNHPRISPQTAKKVRAIMQELNYHPNLTAKSLVSKSTKTLGILLPKQADVLLLNPFFTEAMRGIVSYSTRAGYDLLMIGPPSNGEELEAVIRIVRGKRVDGILILHSRVNDPVIAYLQKDGFPHVLIGRSEEYPSTLTVDTDNVAAAYDATHCLIRQGHRKIGFVSGPPNLVVSRDRLEGYRKAIREAKLPERDEWIVEGDFLQESGFRAMSFLMGLPDRPTALLVTDDIITFGIVRGLTELGYRVPDDLSLFSFNNISLAELANPPISSVDIGIFQLGYTATHLLIADVEGRSVADRRQIIPHRLLIRGSSAPLNPRVKG